MAEKLHAEGNCLFCGKTCAKAGINKHLKTHLQEKVITNAKVCNDFKEYASMPVVNSPRMGVCGYTGGSIDTDRDGVFHP